MSQLPETQAAAHAASLWRQYRSLRRQQRLSRAELLQIRTQLTALLFKKREQLQYPHNFHFWLRWLGIPKSTAYRWMKLTPPPTRAPKPKPPAPPSEFGLSLSSLYISFNPRQAEIFRRAVLTIERNGGVVSLAYSSELAIRYQVRQQLDALDADPSPDPPPELGAQDDLPSPATQEDEAHSPLARRCLKGVGG